MPNFDPILTQKLLGTPFAGVGTTLERNSLQTLMKGLISENKYSVEYIINLCVSYGYSRQLAKEVFTELTGLSPELIVENNEYYQNPVFVPSGTIAWGLSKTNDKIAFYVVPFEYGYALNKKNETEVPEQIAQFVDINSAVKKMKGFVKKVFTIDQIITENLLLNEPIQSSAKNTHDTEEPYFSDPVRNLKNRYKKRYITDGEVKSEAFKLVASEEITEKEAVELAKWVDLEQEKRDIEEDEDTVLDDKDVEFSSVKNDPKGRLQEEAQENSRLKASADEETAKCGWCKEEYPIDDLVEERDFGYLCDSCVRELESRGEEIWLKGSGQDDKQLKASKKIKADEFKLEDITEEENKTSIEKAEEEVNEENVEKFLNETTPQEFFDDEIQKDKIDNLNEKVSKIIDEFSARFEDFEKYDVALQSYKIQMISDDKLDQNETVEDLELNAKALIMLVININPKENVNDIKKGLVIFSVNDNKTYWSGTFKTADNKFYAFTEVGLDALYRDLDAQEEIVEDFVGTKKTSL